MASRQAWFLMAAVAMAAVAFLPAPAAAEDFLVGGVAGWTLNYTIGWPEGKTFKVGDNLVFIYPKGEHTVTEVDGPTFRDCYRQGNAINEWTSGKDTVSLDRPERRWFFCSLADHCEMGLKLVINVEAPTLAPAPPPGSLPPPKPTPNPPAALPPAASPAPAPAPPSSDKSSSAALNHYRRAVAVASAVVAAVFMWL